MALKQTGWHTVISIGLKACQDLTPLAQLSVSHCWLSTSQPEYHTNTELKNPQSLNVSLNERNDKLRPNHQGCRASRARHILSFYILTRIHYKESEWQFILHYRFCFPSIFHCSVLFLLYTSSYSFSSCYDKRWPRPHQKLLSVVHKHFLLNLDRAYCLLSFTKNLHVTYSCISISEVTSTF